MNLRYLENIDYSSYVMCLLLSPHLPEAFLAFFAALTVLIRQTKQAVSAIYLSILLRCLWDDHYTVTFTIKQVKRGLNC